MKCLGDVHSGAQWIVECLTQIALGCGMVFIRTKRQKKNGRVYTYRTREERVWCPVTKKVKSIYLGRADVDEYERSVEVGLRVAERAAAVSDAWQRSNLGATAAELKEREVTQWTQQGFLEATANPQSAESEEDSGEGDKGEDGDV